MTKFDSPTLKAIATQVHKEQNGRYRKNPERKNPMKDLNIPDVVNTCDMLSLEPSQLSKGNLLMTITEDTYFASIYLTKDRAKELVAYLNEFIGTD